MTSLSRGGRLRRWIFWTIGGLTLLLVGGVVFLVSVVMYVRTKNPTVWVMTDMDTSSATQPVTVTMGQVVLRIPRNYFMAMPSHAIAGRPDGLAFVLLGLMPDFAPRTEATHAELADFHGFGRKLSIKVTYKGYSKTGKDLFNAYYKYYADKPMTDAEFGYRSFEAGTLEKMFHGSVDEPKDFISCGLKDWGGPPVVPPEKPFPYYLSCRRTILVGEDIVVDFTFSRDFLGQARDIEQQVIDVLNRFRISGPPLEVIQ